MLSPLPGLVGLPKLSPLPELFGRPKLSPLPGMSVSLDVSDGSDPSGTFNASPGLSLGERLRRWSADWYDGDMPTAAKQTPELFRFSDRVTFLPIINGSGQFAAATARFMLEHQADCLAVPLPPSFADDVESGVLDLPHPSIVIQHPAGRLFGDDTASDFGDDADDPSPSSYVPIDPCQAVIAAIRAAMGERIPRRYIDLETDPFVPYASTMPDPFAVRDVALDKFAAAVLPSIAPPPDRRTQDRMLHMAAQLVELEKTFSRILVVDSVLHWPWIRHNYNRLAHVQSQCATPGITADALLQLPTDDETLPTRRHSVDGRTLMFLFGELPMITAMYERARQQLGDDESLLIDGVKELLLAARDTYRSELSGHGRRITPALLSKCLQYIRNLSLIHRRMTPDLITIITATKQIFGDAFALHVAENANHYAYAADEADSVTSPRPVADDSNQSFEQSYSAMNPFDDDVDGKEHLDQVTLGIDQARLPSGDIVSLVNRLPGSPMTWTTLKLKPRPPEADRKRWQHAYNPYGQCSYPPEDQQIENFRTRVFERAQSIVGNELARTEKFTTSVRDGIDIRDTLRHWYEKQIYVKVIPPSRGTLDACVMLFDCPADPRKYAWRTTWFAEHRDESTLAFYATNYTDQIIGPNIAMAVYGGALFLYPPIMIKDIWHDESLDFAETLEERLIAAACRHSRSKQVAILSPLPPGSAWRRMARHYKKQLVHVPMTGFSDEQIQQMRRVHVLGGKEVRSYAAEFIRKV